MSEIIKLPYFGIILSLAAYMIGLKISSLLKTPIANPLLIATVITIAFLKATGISYEDYNQGGKFITFLIAPATVAMIVKLYMNFDLLIKNALPVFVGITVGVITSVISIYFMTKLFKLPQELSMALIPKSLTTAIATGIAEELGGLVPITIISVIVTGIGGAVIAPSLMDIIKVDDPVAQGIGIGTSSHAVGTSRAIQMGEVQGAMSGLSIALAGFIAVIIIPIIIRILI